jgi:hypothetical protein
MALMLCYRAVATWPLYTVVAAAALYCKRLCLSMASLQHHVQETLFPGMMPADVHEVMISLCW